MIRADMAGARKGRTIMRKTQEQQWSVIRYSQAKRRKAL
jgi:hypothetical protein